MSHLRGERGLKKKNPKPKNVVTYLPARRSVLMETHGDVHGKFRLNITYGLVVERV